jgi:predicted amidohydrolase YtcJ
MQEDLEADPVLRGRPIALKRVDVHATWVSQRAIELAKERHGGDLPKSVEGGEVVRGADGQPTGALGRLR